MNDTNRFDIFVTLDEDSEVIRSVQFQLGGITMTLDACDVLFAKRITAFVAETRGNPAFRDEHLGGGVFRPIPKKSIDLSSSFPGSRVWLSKNGEYDSSFILRIEPCSTFWVFLDIHDAQLDAMLGSLQRIINYYGEGQQDT